MIKKFGTFLFFCFVSANATSAVSIEVLPGPDGTYKIQTSWGDYIVAQDGNRTWVGTEDEYQRERATAIFRNNGYMEFHISGADPHVVTFVSGAPPQTFVGNNHLANIYTDILFGEKPDKKLQRKPKPEGSEYVSVEWIQSAKGAVAVSFVDADTKNSFRSAHCVITSIDHYCELTVPRESLTHKGWIIFTLQGRKPGVVAIKSIVAEAYKGLTEKYTPINGRRSAISEADAGMLKQFHLLDSELPDTIPKPEGVIEDIPKQIAKGCKEDTVALSRKQYQDIKVGQNVADIACRYGPSNTGERYTDSKLRYSQIWCMAGL